MSEKALPAIFLHIPKTGGFTLHDILQRQYANTEIFSCWKANEIDRIDQLSAEEKKNLKIIKGHISLEIAAKVPQKMFFFTILREPVARTISLYYYMRWFEGHYFYREMQEKNYSLKELLEGGFIKNMDNCQVRFLSGEHAAPFGSINETHYQKAIANLDHLMHAYGLVEYYDESLLLLQDDFHWNTPFYASRNVTSEKEKTRSKSNDDAMELLKKYNHYDLMLYAYAKEKFLAKLQAKGEGFQQRVKRFKKLNKWFAKVAFLRRKLFG